jgi:hypothetical protein
MFPRTFVGTPKYSLLECHGRTQEVQYFKSWDKELDIPEIRKQKTWAKTYAKENNSTTFLTDWIIEDYSNLVGPFRVGPA